MVGLQTIRILRILLERSCRNRLAFAKRVLNSGYATEVAQACLDFCFPASWLVRSLPFTSFTQSPFAKSHAKVGMEFVKEFDNEKVPADSPLYRHVPYRIKSFTKRQVFPMRTETEMFDLILQTAKV